MDDFEERLRLNQIKMRELMLASTRKSIETIPLEQLREQVRLNREHDAGNKELLSLLESVLKRREAIQAEIDAAEAKIAELQPVHEEFMSLMYEKMAREQAEEGQRRKAEQDREYHAQMAKQNLSVPTAPKRSLEQRLREENERLRYEIYCATHHQCGCEMAAGETRQYECNDCYWANND